MPSLNEALKPQSDSQLDVQPATQARTSYSLNDALAKNKPEGENISLLEDRNEVIGTPGGMDDGDTEYAIRREIYGSPRADFWGKVHTAGDVAKDFAKGSAKFFVSQLPEAGAGMVREYAEEQQTFDPSDVVGLMTGNPQEIQELQSLFVPGMKAQRRSSSLAMTAAADRISEKSQELAKRLKLEPGDGALRKVAFDLGGGTSSIATSLAIAIALKSPNAAAVLFGGIKKAEISDKAAAAGKPFLERQLLSTTAGFVEGSLEKLGLDVWIKYLRGSKPILRTLLKGASEFIQEGSQELSSETLEKLSRLEPRAWSQIFKNSAYSGLIGLAIGLPAGAAHTFSERKGPVASLRKAGFNDQEIEKIQKAVQSWSEKQVIPHVEKSVTDEIQELEAHAVESEEKAKVAAEEAKVAEDKAAEKKEADDELFQLESSFFSFLEKTIQEKMPNNAPADQVRGILKSSGVKQEEMDWLDIEGFLKGKTTPTAEGKVSKQELLDFIRSNNVKVEEVVKEQLTSTQQQYQPLEEQPKFSQYQLPGGENYKELLLTLPLSNKLETMAQGLFGKSVSELSADEKAEIGVTIGAKEAGTFKSSHFEEPNVLVHIRMNERTDSDGKKVLFIEEIQSDWHQKGRKEGYRGEAVKYGDRIEGYTPVGHTWKTTTRDNVSYVIHQLVKDSDGSVVAEGSVKSEILKKAGINPTIPDAPFKKTEAWAGLAMKRMLRYAAENGFDKIAWTTGEQQAERYDLSKHIDTLEYKKQFDGNFRIVARKDGKTLIQENGLRDEELEKYVGKEIAKKIIDGEGQKLKEDEGFLDTRLSNLDLKVGGEGMKGFYDKIIPSFLNKYTKKWGGRVSETRIDIHPEKGVNTTEGSMLGVKYRVAEMGNRKEWGVFTRETSDFVKSFKTKQEALDFITEGMRVHSLELTPSMKESVMGGQPLFQNPTADGKPSTAEAEQAKIENILARHGIEKITIAVVDQIITPSGDKASGSFTPSKRLVKIVQEPLDTTAFHEAFHVLAREAATEKEIKAVIKDLMATGKYEKELDAEEALADSFATYANQRTKKGLSAKIVNFFDKILQYLKSIIGIDTRAQQLFDYLLSPDSTAKRSAEYKKNRRKKPGLFHDAQRGASQAGKTFGEILVPISTRLKRIGEKLMFKLRRYEFDLRRAIQNDEKAALPFLKLYDGLNDDVRQDLDFALKNGDQEVIRDILSRNGMTESYAAVRKTLDELYERAKKSGMEVGYIQGYHPRKVSDPDGLVDYFRKSAVWSDIEQAIAAREALEQTTFTTEEKATIINSLLRGHRVAGITLTKPGELKERQIDHVNPEINRFYQDSGAALINYIYAVNDAVETRRFFGKNAKENDDIKDSIGAFVLDLMAKGEISGENEKELTAILTARFTERGTSGAIQVFKNLSYIDTMGSVISAITQVGDVAFSMHKNGVFNTGVSLGKELIGQSELSKEDVGIELIAEEFADKSTSARAVSAIFNLTGLTIMDRIGKQTTINAAISKYRKLAQNPNQAFLDKMNIIFGDEAGEVISDLQEGRASENVKFLAFSELADVQPIALSEMPEKYLTSGNGRVFYMLKTFTIKQFDIYRNEVFDLWRTDKKKAIQNLIRLVSFMMLMNASADLIKNFILRREFEWDDLVVDNIARLFGFQKYAIYKARREGVGAAIISTVAPPFKFLNAAYKDIAKAIEDGEISLDEMESTASVPLAGKLYYWWFGKGSKPKKKGKSVF